MNGLSNSLEVFLESFCFADDFGAKCQLFLELYDVEFYAFWLHQDGKDSGDTTSLSLSSDHWGHIFYPCK